MNQESREQLEVRVVALLLGEASDFEAAALQEALQTDPDLAAFHDRMRRTIELTREASKQFTAGNPAPAAQPKLAPERRAALLARFREGKEVEVAGMRTERRRKRLLVELALAAAIVFLLISISIPSLQMAKRGAAGTSSMRLGLDLKAPQNREDAGLSWHEGNEDKVPPAQAAIRESVRREARRVPAQGQGTVSSTVALHYDQTDGSIASSQTQPQLAVRSGGTPKVYLPQGGEGEAPASKPVELAANSGNTWHSIANGTEQAGRNEVGRDAFHRVPGNTQEKKWDAVERVPTEVSSTAAIKFNDSSAEQAGKPGVAQSGDGDKSRVSLNGLITSFAPPRALLEVTESPMSAKPAQRGRLSEARDNSGQQADQLATGITGQLGSQPQIATGERGQIDFLWRGYGGYATGGGRGGGGPMVTNMVTTPTLGDSPTVAVAPRAEGSFGDNKSAVFYSVTPSASSAPLAYNSEFQNKAELKPAQPEANRFSFEVGKVREFGTSSGAGKYRTEIALPQDGSLAQTSPAKDNKDNPATSTTAPLPPVALPFAAPAPSRPYSAGAVEYANGNIEERTKGDRINIIADDGGAPMRLITSTPPQADGKVIIGGNFTTPAAQPAPPADGGVYSVNAVGYVNINPIGGGYTTIADPTGRRPSSPPPAQTRTGLTMAPPNASATSARTDSGIESQSEGREKVAAGRATTLVQDGKLLAEAGKMKEAEAKLKAAIKIEPDNKDAFNSLELIKEQEFAKETKLQQDWSREKLAEISKDWNSPVSSPSSPPASLNGRGEKAIEAQADRARKQKLYNYLTNLSRGDLRKALTTASPDVQPQSLFEQQAKEEQKLADLIESYAPEHPEVKRATESLPKLNRQLDERAANIIENLKSQFIITDLDLEDEKVQPPAKTPSVPPTPQPEVLARDNPFSTFSLNVSDVSFKLAGASLENGAIPDPAAIRVEEFVNAFNYHDPAPAPGARLAFAWERARYPFAHNRDLLRFSVQTAARGREPQKPLNLVILLDNSGSMERADRVQTVREALRVLAGQLTPQDRISVVAFARTARLWVDGMAGGNPREFLNKVLDLNPQGGTNLEEAMDLAYSTARRHFLANGVNRVILLTDGAANLGNVEPEALRQRVVAHRVKGIALDCFGIGWEGYNDDLLEVLSRNGDGRYGFLNRPEEAAPEFANQLAGALNVAAADVKTQVEFNPQRVASWRQIGYAKHQLTKEQFRDNTVDAAEIAAAESGNALYVAQVNPEGTGPIGVVRVRFKVPATGEYVEQEWTIPYAPKVAALDQSSPAMRLAATAAAFGEWLSRSPYAGEVTLSALQAYLSGVPEVYAPDPRPQRLGWMIRQAEAIAGK